MVDVNDLYPQFASMEIGELHREYEELRQRDIVLKAKGEELSDEDLSKVCAILKNLRRRSAGPPKAKPTPRAKTSTTPVDLDLL